MIVGYVEPIVEVQKAVFGKAETSCGFQLLGCLWRVKVLEQINDFSRGWVLKLCFQNTGGQV